MSQAHGERQSHQKFENGVSQSRERTRYDADSRRLVEGCDGQRSRHQGAGEAGDKCYRKKAERRTPFEI